MKLACQMELLPKPFGSKAKISFHLRKAFSVVLYFSSNVKMVSSSDKTATTAASTLISLATFGLAVAFCICSSPSQLKLP